MITDYHLMVMVHAANIANEGSVDVSDFKGDNFIATSRRNMMKDKIESDPRYDPQVETLMKAFEIAGIAANDTARVIVAQNMLMDQKKGR